MTLIDDAEQPVETVVPDKGPPDFIYVCCGTCWAARDPAVPVLTRAAYENDAMRHRTYTCQACSAQNRHQVDVFPTIVGIWLRDMLVIKEGSYAPDAEVEFMPSRWGMMAPEAMAAERGNV